MTVKVHNILKVVAFSLLAVSSKAQTGNSLSDFPEKKYRLNHNGLAILTCWASANIVSGGIGYFASDNIEQKSFHAMNAGWGVINLAIALPGFLGKKKSWNSKLEMLNDQTKTEKVFLANAFLDLTYITGGFLMNQIAENQMNNENRAILRGFGNSVIFQGAGLLIFDATMTWLNSKNRKKNLDPILRNTSLSFNGKGFGITYSF